MNSSHHLASLKQQLQANINAFKKNKENSIIHSNSIKPLKSDADLHLIKNSVHQNINSIIKTKKNSSQSHQCLIKHLKLLLQQAWTKNEFLVRDRADILKENFELKQNISTLTQALQQAKQSISDLKLNGYSGNQVNGMFQNGQIFRIGYEYNSRLVSEKEQYSIQERDSLNQGGNSHSINKSNERRSQDQNQSPSLSQSANEQSLLTRQVSAEFLPVITHNNQSPTVESYSSSEINQTPNYNFRHDMQQNINQIKNHYVDVGSEFISRNNSHSNSGCNSQKNETVNQQIEISMNNINNQLYLPINQNKPCIKQEIQTFKEHLYLVNGSCNQSQSKPAQQSQAQAIKQPDYSLHQDPHNTEFVYCSSACEQGVFRSFYLSLIKYPSYREKFCQNLQELLHDDSFCLFPLYPKNDFWIQIIANFLQLIDVQKPPHEQVLKHINTHKLLDTLLIQALKYRVQFLFNDCNEELNQSINASVNGSHNFNPNSQFVTNRESINLSFQNNSQQNSKFLQFFTALCNDFGLECKKDQKAFYFYQSDCESQSRVSNQNDRPLFVIVNMEQMNAFGFQFSLYFEKSQINDSRVSMNNSQRQMRQSNQMEQYSNSVKRNFKDIQIDQPLSNDKNSQNSYLLNSYNNSSDGKYIQDRSFISQTKEYQEDYDEEQDNSQEISQNTSQVLSYVANTNLHKFNCTTRNITQMMNSSSNDNTLMSLRVSNEGSYDVNSERGRELRERPITYNTMSFNFPIHEELIETQSKEQLYNSFGKSNHISNISSLMASPHVSNNASKVLNQKKENNMIDGKSANNKGKQRYGKEQVQNQNFILKKVKSCQSQESEGVINDYEDEEDGQVWKLNLKLR